MTHREFVEWQVYHENYDPFGEEWLQTGVLAAAFVNLWIKRGKRKPWDYIPIRDRSIYTQQSPEDIARKLNRWFDSGKSNGKRR